MARTGQIIAHDQAIWPDWRLRLARLYKYYNPHHRDYNFSELHFKTILEGPMSFTKVITHCTSISIVNWTILTINEKIHTMLQC